MTNSITGMYDRSTGFVEPDELAVLADDGAESVVAGTTTVACVIGGGVIAASAALPDFCPSGACTTKC